MNTVRHEFVQVMPDGFKLETAVILNEFDFEKGREKLNEVHVSTIFTKPCQILEMAD